MAKQKWNLQKPKESQKKLDDERAEKFGEGSEISVKEQKGRYPWQAPDVREDKRQMVPLYLSEVDKLKLKYISDQTGVPQQRILRDMVLPKIQEKIHELTNESKGGEGGSDSIKTS